MLHEQVVIVSVVRQNVPHIRRASGSHVDELGTPTTASCTSRSQYGFQDEQDLPQVLRQACAEVSARRWTSTPTAPTTSCPG